MCVISHYTCPRTTWLGLRGVTENKSFKSGSQELLVWGKCWGKLFLPVETCRILKCGQIRLLICTDVCPVHSPDNPDVCRRLPQFHWSSHAPAAVPVPLCLILRCYRKQRDAMSDDFEDDELDIILKNIPPDRANDSSLQSALKSSSFTNFSSDLGSNQSQIHKKTSSAKSQRDLFGNIIPSSPISQSVKRQPSQNSSRTSSSKPAHRTSSFAAASNETPTHHQIDYDNLKLYIYPINYEIRDYQFNIIEKCFYNNMLVALPTGLGKTFIAATIILNYWRWFPNTKIIFMAPTRPLVAQQIKACFNVIGLKDQSAVLLDKSKRNRLEVWNDFRIFFTTPQVVDNDLCNGLLDPKSISLLIIDEAHKAKGNYAYNNVAKFLNRFNNSYRTVALTATPSATVEGIKEIVSNLSINRIEIRTEHSIDIIKYFKHKKIDKIDVDFKQNELISTCLLYLGNAVEPYLKTANERHILQSSDPMDLYAFKLLEIQKRNLMNNNLNEGLKWQNHFLIKLLLFIATCIKKLKLYGYNSFKTYFLDTKTKVMASKNKMMLELMNCDAVNELTKILHQTTKYGHPKIEILIEYIENFFSSADYKNSKVIIFSEFRDSALEIVNTIEAQQSKVLRPHIFIGQAPDSNPDVVDKLKSRTSSEDAQLKGMSQKIQKQVIKDFKGEKYNILVATSIGEEGLDIGEVDLIVCFDSTASPIKNIQRLGRTGRKRDGNILMLFSDNERSKFDKAMDNYEWIQKYIRTHEQELVQDIKRMRIIPSGLRPILEKKFIVPEELDVDDNDEIIKIAMNYMKKAPKPKTTKKPKKKDKIEKKFFMPDNVVTGFQNVADMLKPKDEDELIDTEFLSDISMNRSDISMNRSDISMNKSDTSINDIGRPESRKHSLVKKTPSPKKMKLDPVLLNRSNAKRPVATAERNSLMGAEREGHAITEVPKHHEKYHTTNVLPLGLTNNSNTKEHIDDDDWSSMDEFDVTVVPSTESVEDSKPEKVQPDQLVKLELKVVDKSDNFEQDSDFDSDMEFLDKLPQKPTVNEPVGISKEKNTDIEDIVSNEFEDLDGFLSAGDKMDLYTNYYATAPDLEPEFTLTKSTYKSIKTKRFEEVIESMKSSQEEALARIQHYSKSSPVDINQCIDYLNQHHT